MVFDVSSHSELQSKLLNVFQSQIAGGKNYEKAVIGRRLANATFLDAYSPDEATRLCFAMDMTPLLQDTQLCPNKFVQDILQSLAKEVHQDLATLGEQCD